MLCFYFQHKDVLYVGYFLSMLHETAQCTTCTFIEGRLLRADASHVEIPVPSVSFLTLTCKNTWRISGYKISLVFAESSFCIVT